jgi:hypothetical protein
MMEERQSGTYVACKYDPEKLEGLNDWFNLEKIPNPIELSNLHTTIIYSRAKIADEYHVNLTKDQLSDLQFNPIRLDLFDSGDKKALVLVLEASALKLLHYALRTIGATHDYPDYHPHVTLSYEVPDDLDVKKLSLPQIKFTPICIYSEPLNLNWMGT